MAGPYMYLVAAILVFGFLLAKLLIGARPPSRGPQQLSPITQADVEMAVRKGNKVEAIKLYREMTGCAIEEALEVVEDMASRLHPDA